MGRLRLFKRVIRIFKPERYKNAASTSRSEKKANKSTFISVVFSIKFFVKRKMTEKIKTSDKDVLKTNVNGQRKIRFNMFEMTETD